MMGQVGWTRRDVLRAGGLGAIAWAHPGRAATSFDDRAVIFLMLVGGPSQLETWDPKPDAPEEVRGPFGSIATSVPGVRFGEHLPRLARRMDRLTLIRSMHHDEAPIHETGLQLLQTGRLCRLDEEAPHFGSVVARVLGARGEMPPFVMLPGPIGAMGVNIGRGQTAGGLGPEFEPISLPDDAASLDAERPATREAYGRNAFGRNCLRARRLVEAGARCVVVNMAPTVFGRVSWDCHGTRPFSTLDDYARVLLPTLDRAFSALIDDLADRGRLGSTLVVATGEFGRTPRLNAYGGRDHWPGVWSLAMAGGGMAGGRVIGSSDASAARPEDRPVRPEEIVATIYRSLGIESPDRVAQYG